MTLTRKSKLVKWAYMYNWLTSTPIPWSVSFCTFFWRTVLGTPLLLCAAMGVLLLIGRFVYGLFRLELAYWLSVGIAVGILGAIIGISALQDYLKRKRDTRAWRIREGIIPPPSPGFIKTAYKSFKEKYCPIIEIKYETETE